MSGAFPAVACRDNDFLSLFLGFIGSVTSINLPDCNITDEGAKYFALALQLNPVLTRLDLESNAVSENVEAALRAACLINQKRIRIPWSHSTHIRFPNPFKHQCEALVLLGEFGSRHMGSRSSKLAQAFAWPF